MGVGVNTGKYVKMNSTLTKLSTNRYRLTISVSPYSNTLYNQYGIRVYLTRNGVKGTRIGVFTVSRGVCSQTQFTYDFNIENSAYYGAMIICANCEDKLHTTLYNEFYNQTAEDLATYEAPATSSPDPIPTNNIKVFISSTELKNCFVKRWSGSAWVNCNVRIWNGTKWVNSN